MRKEIQNLICCDKRNRIRHQKGGDGIENTSDGEKAREEKDQRIEYSC